MQTRYPAPLLGGRIGPRQTPSLPLSYPVADSHTGILHRYPRTSLTLTRRDGSWLGRPGCAGHLLLGHHHCHAPGSHSCPEGPQLPSSHGAVLPHHPHSSWGIFLVSNWLIVSLSPFACLSGRFFFYCPPDLSWSWGFPDPGSEWYRSASCSSCAWEGPESQVPKFSFPCTSGDVQLLRRAFWSPPVCQKTANGPWAEEEELALEPALIWSYVATAFKDTPSLKLGWLCFC